MKKFIIIFIPLLLIYAPTHTLYCDYGWGYWYWLFGWIGPHEGSGVAAAGFSGSIEYRGYTQFYLPGYPGSGTTINSLVLGFCNNTGGSGLTIDINRVTSEDPGGDECGVQPPIYLTNHPVNSGVDQYTYFDLPEQAKNDFLSAWESGASWFGFGCCGSGPQHFFYASWAWGEDVCAVLLINYTIGVEETEEQKIASPTLSIYPNPFSKLINISFGQVQGAESIELKIYDSSGRLIRQYDHTTMGPSNQIIWDGCDESGRELPVGVYFVKFETDNYKKTEKVVLLR